MIFENKLNLLLDYCVLFVMLNKTSVNKSRTVISNVTSIFVVENVVSYDGFGYIFRVR